MALRFRRWFAYDYFSKYFIETDESNSERQTEQWLALRNEHLCRIDFSGSIITQSHNPFNKNTKFIEIEYFHLINTKEKYLPPNPPKQRFDEDIFYKYENAIERG